MAQGTIKHRVCRYRGPDKVTRTGSLSLHLLSLWSCLALLLGRLSPADAHRSWLTLYLPSNPSTKSRRLTQGVSDKSQGSTPDQSSHVFFPSQPLGPGCGKGRLARSGGWNPCLRMGEGGRGGSPEENQVLKTDISAGA